MQTSFSNDLQRRANECAVPYLETLEERLFDSALIAALPVTWAREKCVLPIRCENIPTLVMAGPEALPLLQHASLVTGTELSPAFAQKEEILRAIDAAYYAGKTTQDAPEKASAATPPNSSPVRVQSYAEASDLLVEQSEPATRFLNNALLEAVRKGASDIHLEPEDSAENRPALLRFRISGHLYPQPPPPPELAERIVSRIKVMAAMDIAEHRLPQDGMAQVRIGGRAIDVRVSTIPAYGGERVVLRLLNRDDSLLPLSRLGMPDEILTPFSSMLSLPNGIVVVSGPTGSGKTTTLYSALGALDATDRNIMTVEDPVEYRLAQIAQIQVRPKIGLTFASGLRHILRQDPDVILVGETRDAETAEIAVRASLTGHLVFTTLHTNDAPGAVVRLLDMGVEPYLLSSCLRGVLAQRLVRRVCPHCATKIPPGAAGLTAAEEKISRAAGLPFVLNAPGCPHCLEGYQGRIGIFESLFCGAAVRDAIHEGRTAAAELRALAQEHGDFHAMSADAIRKLRAEMTTPSEIIAALGSLAGDAASQGPS